MTFDASQSRSICSIVVIRVQPLAHMGRAPSRQNRLFRSASTILAGLFLSTTAMAIDLAPLWDFRNPALSEERFRAALVTARGDDALILETQIARSYGLRKQFDQARAHLATIEPKVKQAGQEARARYALELGRTYASATHPAESQTAASQSLARAAYQTALDTASTAKLDNLAIDAIHMLAFVDTAPADQLRWAREALAAVESSTQSAAKAWEPSIRNNLGYALHQLGRYQEALDQFQQALALRERGTNPVAIRTARWMVAWTLRALQRKDEALALQLGLEQENDAAGEPDVYVFEELEILYRERGDADRAAHYAARHKAVSPAGK
jgi:tetratricopeptide (TPR) repeat protein